MYFLVRTLSGGDSGEALDSEYEGDALTLGGDASAMVHLAVPGNLSIKAAGNGGGKVRARRLALRVNERSVRRAKVAVGDCLGVGGYRLLVIAPPEGFDFALQLAAGDTALAHHPAGLEIAGHTWSMRRSSWAAAGLILALCLLFPLLGWLPDAMWSSGPLASAHRASGIGDKCRTCHEQPFVMVADGACLPCHRDTKEHVDLRAHEPGWFTTERCAGCHREHNEPALLVRHDTGLCVDCHADSKAWPATGDMRSVTAFTAGAHPEFRLTLLSPKGPGGAHGWERQRVRPGGRARVEHSNLKFDHSTHLDPDKVRDRNTDVPLGCASCHRLLDDGEHFAPVTMDGQCRDCHRLNFDSFEPDLELPHGNLPAAVVAMEAHFIREFTDPELRRQRALEKPRRLPGRRDAAASCQGTGLDCGRAEALREAQYQFAETGCISCHKVLDTGLTDISDRWYVQPVRISGDWYPASRFDHGSHLNLAVESGEEVCETCHRARHSSKAEDILIPGRDNCLECHNEGEREVAVECVSCHDFHRDGGSLSAAARGVPVSRGKRTGL